MLNIGIDSHQYLVTIVFPYAQVKTNFISEFYNSQCIAVSQIPIYF